MRRSLAVSAGLVGLMSCGRDRAPNQVVQSGARHQAADNASATPTNSHVALASRPSSDCDWIPIADVEAIVGKLAAPPREGKGGCVYTLPVPQHVLDERAKLDKI